MADDGGKEAERFAADLRREEMAWRSRFDRAMHSDLAAVEIGLVALKTAILVNAGAVVALLAFVGQLWDKHNAPLAAVLTGMKPFVYGLIAAGIASGIAYIYQSIVTVQEQRHLAEVSKGAADLKPMKWTPRWAALTKGFMVFLVFVSYGAFICGALDIAAALGR